jgi:HAD superfamily hydrolase (TIGR01509 family)
MENHAIKAVIFDLGRVLIDFDHTIAAKRISRFTDKTPRQIYNLFFDSDLTIRFEEGKISPQDFFLKVKETLQAKLDYDSFLPIWNEIFFLTPNNRAVHALAKRLQRHYQTVLLSNVNILHFAYVKKEFAVFDVFHHIVASFEAHAIKPKPAIYKRVLGLVACQPQQFFYTDDRAELVEGAAALGIRSFVFKDPEQLQRDLASVGVQIT